ncbi:MAG: TPM domain-containing protein [Candidatus Aminicenantes bacterium]|nr:MAG: TPM domain-containing protein [Candidatus Aminicenantes bacterium]
MAKINFNNEEKEKIKNAVKEAESKTSGEITTAFIKESDNYAVYELMFAVIIGFVYFVVLMLFANSIEESIKQVSWEYSPHHLLMFYGFSTFLVIAIVYLLANLSFIDRLIVSKSVMQVKVNQRAVRHFMESGVYNTKDRTGILIFISSLERRVELLADKGISAKIPQEKWDAIVRHIIDGIKSQQLVKHLSDSIRECGNLLAEHFPIQPDDVNELKDDIHILEG